MPTNAGKALVCAVALMQPTVLLWVVIRGRGMWPVLVGNLLFAVVVLVLFLPYLPQELVYIRSGGASELFDYKNAILTVFEIVTLLASGLGLRGILFGKIVSWICFVGNFLLSLLAVQFVLTFEFKCCGYL